MPKLMTWPGRLHQKRRSWAALLLVMLCASHIVVPTWSLQQAEQIQHLSQLLERVWHYQPELPKYILDQAVGLQGNRARLEKVMMKLITGQPVSLVLLGGSISIRGWNHPDEAYIRQVHKWLELTFVDGCREEVESQSAPHHHRHANAPLEQHRNLRQHNKGRFSDSAQVSTGRQAAYERSRAGIDTWESNTTWQAAWELGPTDLIASPARSARRVLRDGNYESDPRPDMEQDTHVAANPHYEESGHICSGSNIKLTTLAVPAAGPGYAERCVLQHTPLDVDLVLIDFSVNDYMDGDDFQHPEREAYERIMRHVMGMPHRPGVVVFAAYSWDQLQGTFDMITRSLNRPGIPGQDKHQVMAEYYGDVQTLSARASLFSLIKGADSQGDWRRLIYVAKGSDYLHVSLLGHRWYADMIINYLRTVATDVISRLIAASALGSEPGLPLAQAQDEGGTGSTAASDAEDKGSSFPEMLARLFKGSRSSNRRLSSSEDKLSGQPVYHSSQHVDSHPVLGLGTGHRAGHVGRAMLADPRPRDASSRAPVGSSPEEDETQHTAEVPLTGDQLQPPGRPTVQEILTQDLMLAAALNEQETKQGSSGTGSDDSPDDGEDDDGDDSQGSLPGLPPSLACQELVPGRRGVGFTQNCTSAVALRQPFFKKNEAQALGVCAIGADFVSVVTQHKGWDWVDEGKHGVHKWGFVSTQPGSVITMSISLTPRTPLELVSSAGKQMASASKDSTQTSPKRASKMLAWLIYLMSYQGMGIAKVSCVDGCTCEEQTIDALDSTNRIKASVPILHEFTLMAVKDSTKECTVKVENIGKSESPQAGTKFKVIGITTSTKSVWHLKEIVMRGDNNWADEKAADSPTDNS